MSNYKHKRTTTVDGASVERSKTPDPGEGGKIDLPEDHARVCTGDTCWCKNY